MSFDARRRYLDIAANIERIERYTSGMDLAACEGSELVVDAEERCLMRIGEASRKLLESGKEADPASPMHKARGLRNRLSHEYDAISLTTRWEIVTVSLPELRAYCLAKTTG